MLGHGPNLVRADAKNDLQYHPLAGLFQVDSELEL